MIAVAQNLYPLQWADLHFHDCAEGWRDGLRRLVDSFRIVVAFVESDDKGQGAVSVQGLSRLPEDLLLWILKDVDVLHPRTLPLSRDVLSAENDNERDKLIMMIADAALTDDFRTLAEDKHDALLSASASQTITGNPCLRIDIDGHEFHLDAVIILDFAEDSVVVLTYVSGSEVFAEEYTDPQQLRDAIEHALSQISMDEIA